MEVSRGSGGRKGGGETAENNIKTKNYFENVSFFIFYYLPHSPLSLSLPLSIPLRILIPLFSSPHSLPHLADGTHKAGVVLYLCPLYEGRPHALAPWSSCVALERNMDHLTYVSQGTIWAPHERLTWWREWRIVKMRLNIIGIDV